MVTDVLTPAQREDGATITGEGATIRRRKPLPTRSLGWARHWPRWSATASRLEPCPSNWPSAPPHPWASLRSRGLMRPLPAVAVSLVQTERAPWLRHIGGIIRASSARTSSGPNQGKPLEPRGHRVGCIDRLIAPTVRKVSPKLNPTATAIIHKAQGGKLSIAHVPHCAGTI